ncbi:MAG: ATP-binding cassette domain-containing protein [Lactobacillales bacterium]|jgi:ATPase subunit of ABC transporter with duplicated ATPase domains|nr:ATP-binding cassette domain-containing protein [Lactobacillales bacterium]
MIQFKKVEKNIGGNSLFKCENIVLSDSGKIGIVGNNGSGKSTLMKMLAGLDDEYEGEIINNEWTIYVEQIHETSQESGGEQSKREINEAIILDPSVLILDEPTSNLDTKNINWLINRLKRKDGLTIIVSHDREFLKQTVDAVIEFDNQQIKKYNYDYETYLAVKQQEVEAQNNQYNAQQRETKKLKAEIQKRKERAAKLQHTTNIKSGASDAKARAFGGRIAGQEKRMNSKAKAIESRIENQEKVEQYKKAKPIKLISTDDANAARGTIFNIEHHLVKDLFEIDNLKLQFGEKVVLIGENKSGKTTFLKQIMNGDIETSERARMSYFAQNLKNLDEQKSIIENVMLTTKQDIQTARNILGALGFRRDAIDKQVEILSGGELVKASLAKVLLSDSNFLILDEPTNFLDIQAIIALEGFINNYEGAVIIVSHDQTFINNINVKKWEIERDKLR